MANILIHMKDRGKEQKITELCRDMHLSVEAFSDADAGKTLSELAGMNRPAFNTPAILHKKAFFTLPELMIFCGLSGGKLDEFLEEYRRRQIEPVKLKAMLTPANLGWTVSAPATALQAESGRVK